MKNKHLSESLDSNGKSLVKTAVFGVAITNEEKVSILEYVSESLDKKATTYSIVTPNPEIVLYASKHPSFTKILNSAQIALCDGMQLFRAAAFVGKPLVSRITGVEFMESVCERVSKKPITVGFLGGRNGVAKLTAKRLMQKYPGLDVGFVGEEEQDFFTYQLGITNEKTVSSGNNETKKSKLDAMSKNKVDILFVAFGFPKQEEWISKNLSRSHVTVMMSVGGAFDYISGRVTRAPLWIQKLGFEWLYRLIKQPWRFKRQVALLNFLLLVMKEKFKR